jgi:hypothetical protein
LPARVNQSADFTRQGILSSGHPGDETAKHPAVIPRVYRGIRFHQAGLHFVARAYLFPHNFVFSIM